jgi:hypothetical protein
VCSSGGPDVRPLVQGAGVRAAAGAPFFALELFDDTSLEARAPREWVPTGKAPEAKGPSSKSAVGSSSAIPCNPC